MTALSARFDPTFDGYAACETCGLDLPDEASAVSHTEETLEQARKKSGPDVTTRSHSYRVANPSRTMRIQRAIDSIIEDAIADALDEVADLVDADITEAEARFALGRHLDFADAWDEER